MAAIRISQLREPRQLVTDALTTLREAVTSNGSPNAIVERYGCKRAAKGEKSILVVYYTRHGATCCAAQRIATELSDAGYAVDLRSLSTIESNADLSAYDGFVFGSAIYWGAVPPPAVEFFETHAQALTNKPCAFFVTCITLLRDNKKSRGRIDKIINTSFAGVPEFKPKLTRGFVGKLDFDKLTTPERLIMKMVYGLWRLPHGDRRNMTDVAAWTRQIAELVA